MTDFSTSVRRTAPVDTRWRTSKHGEANATPGMILVSNLVEGTHYNVGGRKDYIVPSGLALTWDSDSKTYKPFDGTNLDGFVNNDEGVSVRNAVGETSKQVAVAVLVHGIVDPRFLPITDQRTSVPAATAGAGVFSFIKA